MLEWAANLLEIEWLKNIGLAAVSFIAGSVLKPLWPELWKSVFEQRREKQERNREKDRETLEQLLELLHPDGEIYFLKSHRHMTVHQNSATENLDTFADLNSVDGEFVDRKLERQRKELQRLVNDYANKYGDWTRALPNRPNLRKMTDTSIDNRPNHAELDRRKNELNNLADQTVSAFEDLVRTARRRL